MLTELLISFAAIVGICVICRAARGLPHRRIVFIAVCVVYLAAVAYFTFFRGTRSGLARVSMRFPLPFYKALKSRNYSLNTNRSVLNLLLFTPFGFLLTEGSSLRGKKLSPLAAAGAGLLASLLIEGAQLALRRGVFELDDLVKNTLGAAAGWLLWTVIERSAARRKEKADGSPCRDDERMK